MTATSDPVREPAPHELVVAPRAAAVHGPPDAVVVGSVAGEVLAVGADVGGVRRRDRVVIARGARVCALDGAPGGGTPGAPPARLRVAADEALVLAEDVSDEHATLAHWLATATHAMRMPAAVPGDSALVTGGGTLALATVLLAVAAGFGRIRLLGEHAGGCAALARELGIRVETCEEGGEPPSGAEEIGPDIAFECVGSRAARERALAAVRPGGSVVLVAPGDAQIAFDPNALVMTEKTLVGSSDYTSADVAIALGLVARGAVRADRLVGAVATWDAVLGPDGRLALPAATDDACRPVVLHWTAIEEGGD